MARRKVIPLLCAIMLALGLSTTAHAERSIADIYEGHGHLIYKLIEKQNMLIENQVKLLERIEELNSKLSVAEKKAEVAEEIAKSLRSETFNIKARMTQSEGDLNELIKEQSKGWFK